MDSTFSDDEKRFILSEMIKVSSLDLSLLVDFIKTHEVEPNWLSMQLPNGRNMTQCIGAVENMLHKSYVPPSFASFKRKSPTEIGTEGPPLKRHGITAPAPEQAMPPPVLQPHPLNGTVLNGYAPTNRLVTGPSLTASGKKRGRPSKADRDAQAQQARSAYPRALEPYPPITPAPMASMSLMPREYHATAQAPPPAYDVLPSNYGGQNTDRRARPAALQLSAHQPSSSHQLPSPAPMAEKERAGGEQPTEHADRHHLSPRDRAFVHGQDIPNRGPDNHSQSLSLRLHLPSMQRPPAPVSPGPRHSSASQPAPPMRSFSQPASPAEPNLSLLPARQPAPYEQYLGPDPIFPDRDRRRSIAKPMRKGTPPTAAPAAPRSTSPLGNRG